MPEPIQRVGFQEFGRVGGREQLLAWPSQNPVYWVWIQFKEQVYNKGMELVKFFLI